MSTTTDLSCFGWREKRMAGELLTAMYEQGLPDDFEDEEVTIMMNQDSGNVFLTNSEYQVAMMNTYADGSEKLESFYSCPYCGEEGFKDEIGENHSEPMHHECREYLEQIGAIQKQEDSEEEEAEE